MAYALIFWLAARGLRTRPQLDRLINTLVLASLPVAAYSLLQKLQLDPMTWTGDMSTRVGASLGNPIFLGAYLIMVFCLTIGLLITQIRSAQRQPAQIAVRHVQRYRTAACQQKSEQVAEIELIVD